MAAIDWYYFRRNCSTCARTDEFLAAHQLDPADRTNATRKLQRDDALRLAGEADRLIAIKRGAVDTLDLTADPGEDAVLPLMLGPTGNLRAPLLKVGATLLIGFDESIYRDILLDE